MEPPCMLCEEQEPEPLKSVGETKQVDDEDAERILVGVEHVNEDADVIFVGMSSNSKPVVSNILDSYPRFLFNDKKVWSLQER